METTYKQWHALQQRLVVEQAHHEHHRHSAQDPVDLLDVYAHKLGIDGCAVDLDHPKATNQQHEDQQNPIEIAEGNVT